MLIDCHIDVLVGELLVSLRLSPAGNSRFLKSYRRRLGVVFSLADWVTVLAQGQIIAEGTPDEVRGNPKVQEAYLGGAHA